ncbi:MAG: glycosyltransferase family 39 protein [Anaerolineales bacterium]|nr:glycosyltransferase family 39 protein [Anaerolineales bacterium]
MCFAFSARSALSAVAIVLLAAALRFYRIDHQSYWNDEGNSRVLASRDVPTILRNAAADVHPPGYYLLLKFWREAVGESEFALRGLSALQGVLLVAVLYRLGREWFGPRAGLVAALLGAVNPFLIYYSQEARMYSQLALLSAASFWLFCRVQSARLGIGDWRWIAAYVLATTLGLYTHYAFGFVVLAQFLVALVRLFMSPERRSLSTIYFLLFLPPLLLFLPWLPIAYRHLTGWPAAREYAPFFDSLLDLARTLAFGRTLPVGEALPGIIAVAVLLALGLRPSVFNLSAFNLQSSLWLLLPAALTLALGLLTEAFAKLLLVAAPPLCLLLAAAIRYPPSAIGHPPSAIGYPPSAIGHRPSAIGHPPSAICHRPSAISRVLGWVSLVVVLFFCFLSLRNLYFDPAYFRDDYRGIAQHILRLQREGDAVITNAPNQVEAFAYYYRDEARLFPLPDSRPLDKARTQAQLEAIAAQHDRIFVLYWGDTQADPEKFIESWLNAHTFKAGEQWFGQVRLAMYAAARPATEPATRLDARFGEHIALEGYALSATEARPGDILQLTLFWRTDATLAERYKVFVHLYADVNAPPAAQTDSEPGGGLVLTTIWPPGQRVADNHGLLLPPDLPPGEYRLMLGLYNIQNLERLPVSVGDTIAGDRLDLGAVIVK